MWPYKRGGGATVQTITMICYFHPLTFSDINVHILSPQPVIHGYNFFIDPPFDECQDAFLHNNYLLQYCPSCESHQC